VDVFAAIGCIEHRTDAPGEELRVGVILRVMQWMDQMAPVRVHQDVGDRGNIVHECALLNRRLTYRRCGRFRRPPVSRPGFSAHLAGGASVRVAPFRHWRRSSSTVRQYFDAHHPHTRSITGSINHGRANPFLVRRLLGGALPRGRHIGDGIRWPSGTVQGGDDQSVRRGKQHSKRDRRRVWRCLAARLAGASRGLCRGRCVAICFGELRTVSPADMTLSLDVIYHLIEDHVFAAAMRTLFAWATRFVVIYASNLNVAWSSAHVRHRRFTDRVAATEPDWRLLAHLPNPYPFDPASPHETSFADFFIYGRPDAACSIVVPGLS